MSISTEKRDTVIIGGGQSGLAMSYLLTEQGRDHIVLEKGDEIAGSWRSRWDSFTLVTPNWQLCLPGHPYPGDDPDGFLHRDDVIAYLEDYRALFDPPIRFGVRATSIRRDEEADTYQVDCEGHAYEASNVVLACGTFQRPRIPAFADKVPSGITQIHSSRYRNPDDLPPGAALVVGSGQSGCQIAEEIHESGRPTYLCVGRGGRIPRRYRDRDGIWWAVRLGMADQTVDELDSPADRFRANPQISGKDGGRDIDLHRFARDGVTLLGHLEDIDGDRARLATDLHANLQAIDTMASQFCRGVDKYIADTGLDLPPEVVDEAKDGYQQESLPDLDLSAAGVETIIWATGYSWDYSWIDLPIFDEYGYPLQTRGVTSYPGLYFLGLHFMHTLKSGLFLGVGEDAVHIASHLDEHR